MLTASALVHPSLRRSVDSGVRIPLSPSETRLEVSRLIAQNQMVRADALSRDLLGEHPADEEALVTRILVCEVMHRWQEAATHLRQLLDAQGHGAPAETWYHYVRVLNCEGEIRAALEACHSAFTVHPDHPGLRTELNRLLGVDPTDVPPNPGEGA